MELGLGTAQFGLPYGVMTGRAQVVDEDVSAILECAVEAGIRVMDTAVAYGQGQEKLGSYLGRNASRQDLRIVTKTAPNLRQHKDVGEKLLSDLQTSLKCLKQNKIYALLVHDVGDILEKSDRHAIVCALEAAKESGLVSKIGFSAYDGPDIETVLTDWIPDLIQLPVNILDQRLVRDGSVDRLKQLGIEIHLRSAFLQGVVLASPSTLPDFLAPLAPILSQLREIGDPLELALAYLRTQTAADVVIVGAHQEIQLRQITRAWEQPTHECDFGKFQIDDIELVDPRRWPE
jgi:aryl-alcohol dehydrogenase-like predicted oxidoreductase